MHILVSEEVDKTLADVCVGNSNRYDQEMKK